MYGSPKWVDNEIDLKDNSEKAVIHDLESLVDERFDSLESLKEVLEAKFKCEIDLIQSYKNDELDEFDFLLVGNLDSKEVFCDFDIYYAKSKNHFIITEVSYEFE
jgi:hypothetical protein